MLLGTCRLVIRSVLAVLPAVVMGRRRRVRLTVGIGTPSSLRIGIRRKEREARGIGAGSCGIS